MSSADMALLLLAAGACSTVLELLRPGWVLPGVFGVAAIVAGAYQLGTSSPEPARLLLGFILAMTLWTAAYLTRRTAALSVLAALVLTATLGCFSGARLALTIPICTACGALATRLLQVAQRARRNKAV